MMNSITSYESICSILHNNELIGLIAIKCANAHNKTSELPDLDVLDPKFFYSNIPNSN